ncbi:NACHT, LRR and PYD domains-containing protein 1b allele 3-like [Pangasianodon hypophthalmus]|uniref:NACHT, LRR and PYD domains-containing protein 1b allele 3-like n=1 Tax=Pangasianodon hypophthalmus TaxID=310915 RepID=UPI0023077033|nr:NACHT, LRR and PYD domains-containing protein 1b allele 3-like [Pangasianodon hypophthalmus]
MECAVSISNQRTKRKRDSKILPVVEKKMREEDNGTLESCYEFESQSVQPIPHDHIKRHAENFGEHSWAKNSSTSPLHPDPGHTSADPEPFTPELVENCAKDRSTDEYRFLCPHAGQFMCKLTNLVFEMEGKGEVLYRIVSWDSSLLDELGQKPAGPLYNIDCPEGSICHLHLPHCETRTDVVELTVAHVTGANVEIIQPLKVAKTHVIIHIQGLSLFGLTLSWSLNIRAQVLLFYEKRMSKLYIHLLPENVPVTEVQKIHEGNTYIMTSSKCKLTPGKKYRPCCKTTDCDYVSQPEDETFDRDHGPNYHPTFEVFFDPAVNKVTLSLLDEKDQVVWRPRMVLLTGPERASPGMDTTGADFVDKHRETLIRRFSSVMEVADCLKGKHMITDEMYSNIQTKSTPQDKMRELYTCLDSRGRAVKQEFYDILERNHSVLVDDLMSVSGQA